MGESSTPPSQELGRQTYIGSHNSGNIDVNLYCPNQRYVFNIKKMKNELKKVII